jgi:hypothetical protein
MKLDLTNIKFSLSAGALISIIKFGFISESKYGQSPRPVAVDSIIKEWRDDSLGCQRLRTLEKVKILIDTFDLLEKYPSELIDLLGKPNKVYSKDTIMSIRYYSQSICNENNNKTSDSLVVCWFEFYYPNAKINKCKMLPICH